MRPTIPTVLLLAALAAGGARAQTVEEAYVKASNTDASDQFGNAVAVDGDTMVVGASGEASGDGTQGDDQNFRAGAAYVFVRSGDTWVQQAYLKAPVPDPEDQFGYAVAVSGDTIVVGAPREDSGATGVGGDQTLNGAANAGAAYVFVRSGSSWSLQAYLKASDTTAGDWFGSAVAVDDDTALVGAREADAPSGFPSEAGVAYAFVRTGTVWAEQAILFAPLGTPATDGFGGAIALDGDTALIGASNSTSGAGSASVFRRAGPVWSEEARLTGSPLVSNAGFGFSVDLRGELAIVGAPFESSGASDSGSAYVFRRTGTTWSQRAFLKASNFQTDDNFGSSVAIRGDTWVVGAWGEDGRSNGIGGDPSLNGKANSGALYVFEPTGGAGWQQLTYVKASLSGAGDV